MWYYLDQTIWTYQGYIIHVHTKCTHSPIHVHTFSLSHILYIHTPLTCPLVTDPARWSCGTPLDDDAVCRWTGSVRHYMYYRFLYTSAYEVVEEDASGRHHQLSYHKKLTALQGPRSKKVPIRLCISLRACRGPPPFTELGIAEKGQKRIDCCVGNDRTPGDNGTWLLYHCATCSTKPSLCVYILGFEAYPLEGSIIAT